MKIITPCKSCGKRMFFSKSDMCKRCRKIAEILEIIRDLIEIIQPSIAHLIEHYNVRFQSPIIIEKKKTVEGD